MNALCLTHRLATGVCFLGMLIGSTVAAVAGVATNSAARATSTSRQFAVYSNDPLFSSGVCVLAERIKQHILHELEQDDRWRDPIIVAVRDREVTEHDAPSISVDLFRSQTHLKYQITCPTPPLVEPAALVTTLVEAICSEIANRQQHVGKTESYRAAPVPRWLVHGLAQSLVGRPEVLLAIARRSVEAGRPTAACALLATSQLPSEPLERALFQANAWLFTGNLLALPAGPDLLQRYLDELGAQKSATNAFWSVYHEQFADAAALETWWNAQRKRRVSFQVAQALTAEETGHQLDEILGFKIKPPAGQAEEPASTTVSVDKLMPFYEQPWLKGLLKEKLRQLFALAGQAHPIYRPVIAQYIEAYTWLTEEKLSRFKRALKDAERARSAVERQMDEISEFLHSAERRYSPEDSTAAFQNYFRILEHLESIREQRRNPITDYLNQFDK